MKYSRKIGSEILKKRNSKYFLVLLVLFGGISLYEYFGDSSTSNQEGVVMTKCVDGDTAHFVIDGKDEKVRFLAIDAPETAKENKPADPYGDEAAKYTCKVLNSAQEIKLEYEEERTDKYGRVLAWVWVDGKLLQEGIVKEGLAQVKYLYDDYKYTSLVKKAQTIAKSENNGMWSDN